MNEATANGVAGYLELNARNNLVLLGSVDTLHLHLKHLFNRKIKFKCKQMPGVLYVSWQHFPSEK